MLKKFICSSLILTATQITFAERCPSPEEIKSGQLHHWQVLNINSGSTLPNDLIEEFKTNVRYFALAEWMADAPEGSGHCYYHGRDNDDGYLNVFLAKANLTPAEGYDWKRMDPYVMQCHTGLYSCVFQ